MKTERETEAKETLTNVEQIITINYMYCHGTYISDLHKTNMKDIQ